MWILQKVAIIEPGYPAPLLKRFHVVNVCEHTDEVGNALCEVFLET